MALWGGRFIIKSNSFFKIFNSSVNVDYQLAEQDIISSIAWSEALYNSNVLTQIETNKIKDCLRKLLKVVQDNPKIVLDSNSEDVHSWVEDQLINDLGDLGKKLHTGRSRNDQIATDLKLWCKFKINDLLKCINSFKQQLIILAEKSQKIIMPGYTHLQRAQPITFAFWCLAYVEMLKRDESRLLDTYKRLDVSPLGCGALSGTSWYVDREKLAKSMGFSSATNNSLDSVSDRDYVIELAAVASIGMVHLSRFSEDLIFFNSSESNFIELSDSITSGSSLMPQKKNPDALELIRAKSGRVFGFLMNILVILKGLPLSYNKDMQEDKEGLFSTIKVWSDSLVMATVILDNLYVNSSNCLQAAENSHSNSTELADYLVKKGITFRDAHHITGKIVLLALNLNIPLEKIDLVTFKKFSSKITDDVYDVLNIHSLLKKRNSKGGVSPELVSKVINVEKKRIIK